jgi:hypothetical protein
VYADARREGIARPAAGRLDSRKSSGMYSAIGSRGRTSRRCVYVDVVRVSCVERFVRRSAWSIVVSVHACFYGVFVIGLGGVLEGAAEAGCCGLCGHFT